MGFRHEWKFEINEVDRRVLKARLAAVMQPDSHAKNNRYRVRSLYFDTPADTAFFEKIDGVNRREKFRIRMYDDDPSFLRLEKKSKVNGLCQKVTAPLTKEQTEQIIAGNIDFLRVAEHPLLRELYVKMRTQELRPKSIVEYTREPFVFSAGNVRVTIDSHLRTGVRSTDFLNPAQPLTPAADAPPILEVKWDAFLPDIVRDAVGLESRRVGAFSKYAKCRIYG